MGVNLKIIRRAGLSATLVVLSVFSISCNGVNDPAISIKEIERFATETMQALRTELEIIPTSTTVPTSTLESPTPIPPTDTAPPDSTPILPAATRISFDPGATSGVAKGVIEAGKTQNFVLGASTGQPLQASVFSQNNDVTMSITTEDGVELLPSEQGWANWQGTLPKSGDIYFQVIGGKVSSNFTLSITISHRIEFEAGAVSATVNGKTVNGNIISYVVAAQGGQTMDIVLTGTPDVAALTVWGFSDGQPLIRAVSGSTTFNRQLPSTQDYIINVVPQGSQEVEFTLRVEIK